MGGDSLAKLFQHLDGRAQVGGGGSLHGQVELRRWMALRRRLSQCFSSSLRQ